MVRASIIGGSGYTGGELLRLLLPHPEVELVQVTSRHHLGEYLYQVHPNLRKKTDLTFTTPDMIEDVDVLFLAMPHGQAQGVIDQYSSLARYIIDLSADFRLHDPQLYKRWYGVEHANPSWLPKFVYGLPELHRGELKTTRYASGVGCNATACNLAIYPLIKAGLLDTAKPVIFEVKVGSSEAGAEVNPGSHHPERSNVIRTYAPFGHRHTGEIMQELGLSNVTMTVTSVDLVRGALATAHGLLLPGVELKDLWRAYRSMAEDNPFVRIVKEKRGIYRVPEPKILAGSNFVDLGFDFDPETNHVIAMGAIDNLMKGASGSAVQCMNLMLGFEETLGLEFTGLHPI